MNNFGVIEVASTKTTHAPGWAYVPDTPASAIPSQSVSAVHLHVNRNKRAARNTNAGSVAASSSAVNERHDAKLQKEIEQLQRDTLGGRDAQIPIPSGGRDKDGKIRGHTANVRKILASQKTFANHLDDFEAWSRTQGPSGGEGATAAGGSAGQSASGTPTPTAAAAAAAATSGAAGKRGANTTSSMAQKRGGTSSGSSRAAAAKSGSGSNVTKGHKSKSASRASVAPDTDVVMTDAPPPAATAETDDPQARPDAMPAEAESQILTPFTRFTAPSHPGDADPLLASWLPPLPTDEELRELMRAPPLNYNQARGAWTEDDDKRYPTRHFCEVCGYWGRVRCMKCGTRVCALDCLDVHREDCITRYGL